MTFYVIFDKEANLSEYKQIKKWKHHQNGLLVSINDIENSVDTDQKEQMEDLINTANAVIILIGSSVKTMPGIIELEIKQAIKHEKNIITVYLKGYDEKDSKVLPDILQKYRHVRRIKFNTPLLKKEELLACQGPYEGNACPI